MKKEIITKNDETEHRYYDESGDANLKVCHVFDGVDIIFNSVHMKECDLGADISGNLVEIHHCREGRFEHEYGNELVYLMPGDLSVARRKEPSDVCRFPLHHYHGITIVINEDIAPKCFSCLMKDVEVAPTKMANRLCGKDGCFVVRNQDYVEHIFSELYAVPESHKKGFFKIKVLELLFVLSWIEISENEKPSTVISVSQATLARDVADYLARNKDRKVSADELTQTFYSSEAQIRKAFKAVYGIPVASYMRIYKMQAAALDLIQTEKSVLEIAGECGYDNASKFSAAFKEIMGEAPLEYRKAHTIK